MYCRPPGIREPSPASCLACSSRARCSWVRMGRRVPPALGPAGLELQVIAPVRPAGLDLEGLLPSQPKGLLQAQAHPYVFILDPGELFLFQVFGLALSDTNCRSGIP